jgi:NAD(P)-dependent dehydrogenase (short-subunit alcohol dehydrogenase family)
VAELTGLTAVVAGTSPNIGASIAVGLAEAGARVGCVDRDADNARDCAQYLTGAGHQSLGLSCDVTDEADVERTLDALEMELDGIDVVVNGAAFYNAKGILEMPVDEWRLQIDVILTGAFLMTRGAARRMIAGGRSGSVVNLISTAGHQGQPGNISYSTAKSGLLNFTRAAAMDLARFAIRVNSVTPTSTDPRPGWDVARAWGRQTPEELSTRQAERERQLPIQRMPSPSDCARAVVFLASPSSEAITGTDLAVDGGALSKYWAWDPAKED